MVYYKDFLFEDSVDAVIVDDEYISFGGVGKEFYISLYLYHTANEDRLHKEFDTQQASLLKVKDACEVALEVLRQHYYQELKNIRKYGEETSSDS